MSDSQLKDTFSNILRGLKANGEFLVQIAADVSALKIVVSSFGPEVRDALQKQIDVERRMFEQQLAQQNILLSSLQGTISKMKT